jgi:exopolysaccharide biosynthesis protein
MLNLTQTSLIHLLTTDVYHWFGVKKTTVHTARYRRQNANIRIAAFKKATYLIDWCHKNNVTDALNGGFFCRRNNLPLGDIVINDSAIESAAFIGGWGKVRGCLAVNEDRLDIVPRFAAKNFNSLIQAGPTLLMNGINMMNSSRDTEGFSISAADFDSDITNGRYPRAAIGFNEDFIWSVAVEGYAPGEAGMSLFELAEYLRGLGAARALNLDGGGSATLISGGNLINRPRTRDLFYPSGRAIYSAIVFEKA